MLQRLAKPFLTACVAYSSHYAITKAYSSFCVPDGVWGFFQGPFTTGSPLCSAIFSSMSATQMTYNAMVTFVISDLLVETFLFSKGRKETQQPQEQEPATQD